MEAAATLPQPRAAAIELSAGGRTTLPRLVVVGPTPAPFHGVSVMTASLVAALRELGALAGHLDTRDPRPVSTIGRLDFTNLRLGAKQVLGLHRLLVRTRDADVLLPLSQGTWGFLRDAALIGVGRAHGRRVHVQLHGGHLHGFVLGSTPPMRALIRLVLANVDTAWALTPSLERQFDGLVHSDRVTHVENAVEDTFEDPASRERPQRAGFRLLFVSNLLADKGVPELMSALRGLGARGGSWEVRLVGEVSPDARRVLLEEIGRLPQGAASVRLLGPRYGAEKRAQYAWADAFVFPAREAEGQPLVLLEAMCAALPIVATKHAGVEDTIANGLEGVLVPRSDPRALAEALVRLAEDRCLRRRLGAAARQRYERRYRLESLTTAVRGALEACCVD
jgi:glycosyltransferase involved in cell wall biosynthesis